MPGVDVVLPILLEVASRAHREPFRLAEGDVLIRAGSRPSALFLLMDGECEVVLSSVERVRVAAPTVFGEISFVGDTSAVAEVRALGPCTVIPLEHALLLDPARLSPVEVLSVIRALTRICLDRVAGGFHPPYTALIAHDGRKDELLDFVREHRDLFATRPLLCTGTTGARIEAELGLRVAHKVASGPMGGDQDIGGMASRGKVEAVFFFRDPLSAHPHLADVHALLRVCDVADVPIATNRSTAEAVVAWLGRREG
jgi:methylglyoxal synthase